MNIYEFFNSKDIANHLAKINYQFTPLEMAFIIYQSNKPFAEKEEAWSELIATTPDCEVKHGLCYEQDDVRRIDYPSLHDFLSQYISLQHRLIEQFVNPESGVWFCEYKLKDGYIYDIHQPYHDPEHCMQKLREKVGAATREFQYIIAERRDFLVELGKITLSFNKNMDIVDIDCNNILSIEEERIFNAFKNLLFGFPMPFKRGDIVTGNNRIMVLEDLPSWRDKDLKQNGDSSDMYAYGFGATWCGNLMDEWIKYMDLEFYRGRLIGNDRILKATASFLNEKVDVVELLFAHHQIVLDEFTKYDVPDFSSKKLELLGLKREQYLSHTPKKLIVKSTKQEVDVYCKEALRFWLEENGCIASAPALRRNFEITFERAVTILHTLQNLGYVYEGVRGSNESQYLVLVKLKDLDSLFTEIFE